MGNFMKLRVWQDAKEIAVKSYQLTRTKEFARDFGLKDQIQRSAVSIASNIAEGDGMGSDKQSVRYFYIARGSVAELTTQIIIAHDIGYLDDNTQNDFLHGCDKLSSMLTKLIKARSQ